jgi:hypothetical protein
MREKVKMPLPANGATAQTRRPDGAEIRKQLERMLAHPLFKNSQRYPKLLRHVVGRAIEGRQGELKERTMGIELFGRMPGYDTNADPIVRATAGEIRKHIALYYQDDGREDLIRIRFSPGSYIPEFRFQQATRPAEGRITRPRRRSALNAFWDPVLESTSAVLLCVGQRQFLGCAAEREQQDARDLPYSPISEAGGAAAVTLFELYYLGSQNVAFSDAGAVARLAGLFHSEGKSYQVRGERATTLFDLRSSPVVLVGAFNNDWTMRLTGPLRFGFERTGDIFWLKDHADPDRQDRAISYSTPYLRLAQDYALVSRVLDPTTDRMVVAVGGLTGYGTAAAAEFLSGIAIEAVARDAPRKWARKNLQLVVGTEVIAGHCGPARLLETHFW